MKKSIGDGTRVLVPSGDETESFDIDVALDSSKISSSTSTSKAGKIAFTTMSSSIASGVIVGGISLFLFVW